jgi:signal transduction histidine kinase/predicted ATPase
LVGRKAEQDKIRRLIEKFGKSRTLAGTEVIGSDVLSLGFSTSDIKLGSSSLEDTISENASARGTDSTGPAVSLKEGEAEPESAGVDIGSIIRRVHSLNDTKGDVRSIDSMSVFSTINQVSSAASINSASVLLRQSGRKRKGRHSSLVIVTGAPGFGKSALLQVAQTVSRQYGYYAGTKFDGTRKVPYEPLLRMMASLFRQIFSEPNLSTPFHRHIRNSVQPIWPVLHSHLGLPSWLLDQSRTPVNQSTEVLVRKSHSRKDSSSSSPGPALNQTSEWLRGTATKSSRFMTMYAGVLQVITSLKPVTFGFDDLQFADNESLELINHLVSSNIPVFIVGTTRDDTLLARSFESLLKNATKLDLAAFSEEETAEFVSATLHREREYVLPLVAVIQEKAGGNPFFVREMLETMFQKEAIYYSWTKSAWEYDLDKIFSEFVSQDYGSQINNDFVSKRIHELPSIAKSLLAWAALLGNTFQFSLIKSLMAMPEGDILGKIPLSGEIDPILGLQSAEAAFIIIACDDEDRFRFAHDRYHQAAMTLLNEFDQTEMHYFIVKILMSRQIEEQSLPNTYLIHMRSRHICQSLNMINQRETHKGPYRTLLYAAAENSMASGAKAAAIPFIQSCIQLLGPTPWVFGEDSSYEETLKYHVKAAECFWHEKNFDAAMSLVQAVFANATSVMDMAPCWIIEARVYAGRGNSEKASDCLRSALEAMGVRLPQITTMEQVEEQLQELWPSLTALSTQALLTPDRIVRPGMEALGIMLVEFIGSAFYTSEVLLYQAAIAMVKVHLDQGAYAQCGIGYLHIASMLVSRPGMLDMACHIADYAQEMFNVHLDDTFTAGRGLTLHSLFFGHLQYTPSFTIQQLSIASDASLTSGDRIVSTLNTGVSVSYRLWLTQDLTELDFYIRELAPELLDWETDLRGGVLVVAAHQFIKAIQGQTNVQSADMVFDDESHLSADYEKVIRTQSSLPERQLFVYWTYKLMALVTFGFENEAFELAEKTILAASPWASAKFVYDAYFYCCLSMCTKSRTILNKGERIASIGRIEECCQLIRNGSQLSYNHAPRVSLIQAEIAELQGDVANAMSSYEHAMDAAQENGFSLEEALISERYADLLLRQESKRPAKQLLMEAISIYRRINAHGKVKQLQAKHSSLLHSFNSLSVAETGVQTDIIDTGATSVKLRQKDDENTQHHGVETSQDRTSAWVGPNQSIANGSTWSMTDNDRLNHEFSAIGLDMIDLASILESNQLISSELDIEKLMGKMAEIITEISAADLVGIVIKDEKRDWVVKAIGTADGVQTFPDGVGLDSSEVDQQLALKVTNYVLRFRERVLVHNLLDDDRFSGVSTAYQDKNPQGKAIIALPIIRGSNDLLGAIHVEGAPGKFTQRHLQVLHLLVNQISISLANAFDLKKIEKVSLENAAMVDVQRTALERARRAEAEAIRNMHLKEEAANAKALFLANVSHELRTPLNGVIGMSELLKSTQLTKPQAEFANSIQHCADTLLSLINDLLDYTKLDSGKMTMVLKPVGLCSIVHEVVRALSYSGKEKNLRTTEELQIDENLLVIGDSVRFHQVLMNLLSNAYKFTSQGGVTIKMVADYESSEAITVTTTVSDTGIGVPDEQREKLFKPFSQVDSDSSRNFPGTGLGLSICKALVEGMMGGNIWLDSEIDKGTTVGFRVHFRKATKEDIMTMDTSQLPARGRQGFFNGSIEGQKSNETLIQPFFADLTHIPRSKIRICIAEDNPINQRIAVAYVKRLGFDCEAVYNGALAIDALEEASKAGKPFHVVLMDIQMPTLSGYDATKAIRKSPNPTIRDILIIAMTASAIQGDREKCMAAGMNDYLSKPVR